MDLVSRPGAGRPEDIGGGRIFAANGFVQCGIAIRNPVPQSLGGHGLEHGRYI
jgi:hypothetical protein